MNDSLHQELSALSTGAPAGLIDKIAARWFVTPSPLGDVFVAYTDRGVAFVRLAAGDAAAAFTARVKRPLLPADRTPPGLAEALRVGDGSGWEVDLRSVTGFQADVLDAARTIPKGHVRPYGWIAAEIGRPKAVRAVGTALATNPVPLIVPCHRVVRSDGGAGQYIFGGDTKLRLLHDEKAAIA